jgi:hypothetical protein
VSLSVGGEKAVHLGWAMVPKEGSLSGFLSERWGMSDPHQGSWIRRQVAVEVSSKAISL